MGEHVHGARGCAYHDLRRHADVSGLGDGARKLVRPATCPDRDLLRPHADRDRARAPVHACPDESPLVETDRVRALDGPGKEVRRAQEARNERGRGSFVEHLWRAELLDAALVHDRDRVGHGHRLFLVVRDVDERDPDLLLDALQLELHLLAQLHVERTQRFVEQKHARVVDERSTERDPLLLASRELLGLSLPVARETD